MDLGLMKLFKCASDDNLMKIFYTASRAGL